MVGGGLVAGDGDDEVALVGGAAVFEEVDALPGAEGEAVLEDGDDFAGAGEGHADVAWHVIRAFAGVGEPGGAFRDEAVEEFLEVVPGVGVGIFHEDE